MTGNQMWYYLTQTTEFEAKICNSLDDDCLVFFAKGHPLSNVPVTLREISEFEAKRIELTRKKPVILTSENIQGMDPDAYVMKRGNQLTPLKI